MVDDGHGRTDTRITNLTITNTDRPPTLGPVANMTVVAGAIADQTVCATDPDGDFITFHGPVLPPFATLIAQPQNGNTQCAIIHLAPPPNTTGTFAGQIYASANGLNSGTANFIITITVACNCPPTLAQPANMSVIAGQTADQTLQAASADGLPLTFTKVAGPAFMVVTTTIPGTGTATGNIHLAPGPSEVGTYLATVRASNGAIYADKSFTITVQGSGNQCPTANPGGPYSGLAGVPVNFSGSASSDPDGDPLTYAWDFDASNGIQVDAVGSQVSHAYAVGGVSYVVTLTVTDNGNGNPAQVCSSSATTTASITASCSATVFNGQDKIKLEDDKAWFALVQPASGCYSNSDVDLSSFVLKYAGRQIPANIKKTTVGGDKNHDGIQEIRVTFSKANLRTLFTGLPIGHNLVAVELEANLTTGGSLRGSTQVDVVNHGDEFDVAVAPNPLNPQATLTYSTSKAGFVRIEMFDIQGRLVRRLVDEPAVAAGAHEATVDGRNQRGESLPSGVYYIRGTFSEGGFKQVVTILK